MTDEELLWEITSALNDTHDEGEWNDLAEEIYGLLKQYRPEMYQAHVKHCEDNPID